MGGNQLDLIQIKDGAGRFYLSNQMCYSYENIQVEYV